MYEVKTAVILAAGCGSRLKSLSNGTPKCLLKVGNELILARLLRQLNSFGIEKLVIVVGYEKVEIPKVVKSFFPKAAIIENNNYLKDKNLNSFTKAINIVDEGCLVFTSDIILDDKFINYSVGSLRGEKSIWYTNGNLKKGVVGNVIKSDVNSDITDIRLISEYSDIYKDYTKWTGLMAITQQDLKKYKKVCKDISYKSVPTYYSQPFVDNLSRFNFKEFNLKGKYRFATFNTPKDYKDAIDIFS